MYSRSSCWEWNNYRCGSEDETACDAKVGPDGDGYSAVWSEGVINGTSEFSVWRGSDRAVFNDAYRNGVANRDDADLVLVSDLMVWWYFLCLSLFE